ncbi:NADH:flavin oxidoreductase/NADH oxidase family protein [Mycobacterium montefiorense]|uniref:NADH oxidoreductase n=2 Tax=Mycobacterium montefiorense TaxID=154654 RepID=A0AA37PL05_9MYCO|nr:NADH:flavin oxidoreductase/NADH oxidase family protein [Mycobacterium montefiorense]GKU37374.1 NADH oxidoreductase [Mycobacterium montefiorense]GKU42022.1 NADH oxidoreductase [Mycobacterium montefiorense]GKU45516.1 NADH oxidoreductase [Mycobacterium montefiorense]GKU63168.1 NADH oxidoreductase [Mycobacterium montefiorense]GKU66760.1 NADH oxidoreductase [Mycobacterium montefiorense]
MSSTSTVTAASPLTLPCGVVLPNRIAKAAMSEQLGQIDGAPSQTLTKLYHAWGRGGAGLLVTGNVMIDRRAYVEPRNVTLEDDRHLGAIGSWARAGAHAGSVMVMQINHPGRVAVGPLYRRPVGPSALRPQALGFNLRKPRALTIDDIADLRRRYTRTAQLAVSAGFAGVQVHAAHGYLLSQFLSPVANRRDDRYGGNAENRRRLLLEIIADVRAAIGPAAVLSVKLNSADVQQGGLEEADSLDIALALERADVDLLEISGGNYEAPAMTGIAADNTRRREAYFLRYAEALRAQSALPLMLTGGIRTLDFINDVIAAGSVDVIGLGRPFALQPDIAARLLAGERATLPCAPRLPLPGLDPVNSYLQLAWHAANFRDIVGGAAQSRGPGAIRTLLAAGTTVTVRALTQP